MIALKDEELSHKDQQLASLNALQASKDNQIADKDRAISAKDEQIDSLKSDLQSPQTLLEKFIARKDERIASLEATLRNSETVDLTSEESKRGTKRFGTEHVSRNSGSNSRKKRNDGKSGHETATMVTRGKTSLAPKVKRENILNGDVQCPECSNIIPVKDGHCNIVACTNHSPQFVYFCVHCKKVNDNGVEYVTCQCSKRNTKETRLVAQEIRNEESRANPISVENFDSSAGV